MSKILDDLIKLAEKISNNTELSQIDKDETIEFLLECLEKFPEYFNAVIMTETQISILRFKYDQEEYVERIQKADQHRRDCHILATDSINKINRMAKTYNMEPIFKYPGVEERELVSEPRVKGVKAMEIEAKEDRRMAADMVYAFCKEVFLDDTKKELYNKKTKYTYYEREEELYEIGKNNDNFETKVSLDELIEKAKMSESDVNQNKNSKENIEKEM